jgi:hypothetical protein
LSGDRNYNNVEQSGPESKAKRVDDVTIEPPTNEAIDRNKAAEMANLLGGLEFPTTKQKIRDYINKISLALDMNNRINDVLEAIEANLDDDTKYNNAYEIERAVGLIERSDEVAMEKKPYVRDRALNIANKKRTGEEIRQDPYSGQENILPANKRNVSPNTPTGEEI